MMCKTGSGDQKAAAVFFDRAATSILQQLQGALPDLRAGVVILPNYHVAPRLARHLVQLSGVPALLLPHMTTLNDWMDSLPLAGPVIPDSRRAAMLYQALRDQQWFAGADLWGIAHELLELLDEMTRHHVQLPQSGEAFLTMVEQAYRSKRNSPMQFEASVVHALWYAMNNGEMLDQARAKLHKLAQLAADASRPLTVLLTSDLSVMESRFLEAYGKQAPVNVVDMRELLVEQEAFSLLNHVLGSRIGLSWGAEAGIGRPAPSGSLKSRLALFGANGLEQEARAAELQVRRWLLEGKQEIALVAQDRLVARRVRALLERAGILASDETGWTLTTLSVSTVLMRWLDVLQGDYYHQDLLDLLKSPFLLSDIDIQTRRQTIFRFECKVRRRGVVSGIRQYLDLAQDGDEELRSMLERLEMAGHELAGRRRDTLHGWLAALERSLDVLGAASSLRTDDAGKQMLDALMERRRELEADKTRFSLGEWRHWLALQLDAQTWRDRRIESPVKITHLAATRWRKFDAVILLGCDDAHLPGGENVSGWFNDAVRHALGLPVREVRQKQQRDDLLSLLVMNEAVLATWQSTRNDEANLISPYLEILQSMHVLAYGDDLSENELAGMLEYAVVRGEDIGNMPERAGPDTMPAPVVPPHMLPASISASAYNSLVACPYQYFSRHVLHLNEQDEVREEIEKRDFGEWVHVILKRFHEQYPVLGEVDRALLEHELLATSREIFEPRIARNFWARAWFTRWQQAIPAYIAVQMKSEADGWRFGTGEAEFDVPVDELLNLRGRVDRIDLHAEDQDRTRVVDYKLREAGVLRKTLKEAGEDVQLPFYAHALSAEEASYLSIDREVVAEISPPQEMAELAGENMSRLKELFSQMRGGAGLPANGIDDACRHCEMQGVCRKAEWSLA